MKRGLNQPHSGEVLLPRPIQNSLHQLASDAAILRVRIDGDRPQAGDGIAFVQAVAAGDAAVGFGNYAIGAGQRNNRVNSCTPLSSDGKSGGKLWLVLIFLKCFVADLPAGWGIFRFCAPDDQGGLGHYREVRAVAEAFGLHPAYRDLGLLFIVHAELETRLEPRNHFL